ncbi:MAG: protease modulator HflC [Burkholderiaceae bacterium]
MANRAFLVLGAAVVAAFLVAMSTFAVRETELAIKFRFGEIVRADYAPGLHFMIPMVNNIRKFERRIVTRNYPSEQFLTSEGKILRIDFYIKWRISDVSTFYQATSGGDEEIAAGRLASIVKDGIKGVIARRTIQQVVVAERNEFTGEILKIADPSTRGLGLQLVDVRVKKIDLPEEVSESVFSRMRQDFDRQAKRLRAEGFENAEKLRSEADRERTEILAEAYRDAEIIRGEGDANAADTYAKAYSQNAEFYSFHRSLQAYREALGTESDILVISPDSEFFKYLNRPDRR